MIMFIKLGITMSFYYGYLAVDFNVKCTSGAHDTRKNVGSRV